MARPPRRFSRDQRRRVTDLLKGVGNVNAVLRGLSDEVAQILLTYEGKELTPDDIAFIDRRIKDEIDRTYGATQARAKTSPMFRAMDDAIADSVINEYASVLDDVRDVVSSVSPDAWNRIDTLLTYGPDTDDLAGIKRMMDLPQVARRRALKQTLFDPSRRWVPKDRHNTSTGYDLSQRVWKAGRGVRNEIDAILADYTKGTYEGRDLYAELDKYLNPDKAPYRYRKDGTLVRRRGVPVRTKHANGRIYTLLQTEMQRANYATTLATAQTTPGVVALRYLLSNHPRTSDECDPFARGSSAGMEPGVYTFAEFPAIPRHPRCRCAAAKVTLPPKEMVDAIISKYLGRAEADQYMDAA